MTEDMRLDVVYCEGWDPETRRLVGRLPAATARERDRSGEQYAVALLVPETGQPRALLEICWRHRFARCWEFDGYARRYLKIEYRRLAEDQLFIVQIAEWGYQTPEQPEFDEERARQATRRYEPEGVLTEEVRPNGRLGGLETSMGAIAVDGLTLPFPRFGDWMPLTAIQDLIELHQRPDAEPTAAMPVDRRPWRPPLPLQPTGLEEMFTPGMRYLLETKDVVTIDVRSGGTLYLPSGRLMAADPGWLSYGRLEPFEVTVPPGKYAVELAVIRFAAGHERVAAAKLVIAAEPVTSWEMALSAGQDPVFLDEGQFYGFDVDAGMGCFFDADALAAMGALAEESFETIAAVGIGGETAELVDPESDANLIAFSSGWGDGSYPTWIGRTADGRVACFVADMLILNRG